MLKQTSSILLICVFLLCGCTGITGNQNEKVAAVVRGEEMTIGSLRLLYPEEVLSEMMEEAIQAKLAEQEVKKMNKDISSQAKEIAATYEDYPKENEHTPQADSIRRFAETQAEQVNMEAEKFYEKYVSTSSERKAYLTTYVASILGEPEETEADLEDYYVHANEVLENLMERNKEDIDIRFKP